MPTKLLWTCALPVCACLLLSACLRAADSPTTASGTVPGNQVQARPPQPIKGLWVWQDKHITDAQGQDEMLAFCQRHGINLILVQVHYAEDSNPPAFSNPQGYVALIAKASDLGIRVEALDGSAAMAMAENQERTLAVLSMILELNKTMPAGKRFSGVHYDIEPHAMPEFGDPAHRTQIMADLLGYYAKAADIIHQADPDMTLSCDIPAWYEVNTTEDGLPLTIEFAGQTKPLQQHIQDLCDYVGIMAYSRQAIGPDSITDKTQTELQYAAQIGKVVCSAIETVELQEYQAISFHGETPEVFNEQFELAWNTMADKPGFGGMLIHYYGSARELLEPKSVTTGP